MENAAYIALSRQTALLRQMDVVANNIANANTDGFKGEHVLFAEFLADGGTPGPTPLGPMSYVEDVAVARDLQEGNLLKTDNELDFAIHGSGWFAVETPAGTRYTRAGGFQLNPDREIVTAQGYRLLDDGDRPIALPADAGSVTVTRDGSIMAGDRQIGRIGIVGFANEQALRKTMGGLYTTDQAPQPAENAEIVQGMIEQSNVKPVVEMTRMMEILRSFEATQKMVDGEHERLLKAIRTLPDARPA